jgi:hypothetical protein
MPRQLTPKWLKDMGFTIVPLPSETLGLFHLLAKANGHYGVVGEIFKLYSNPPAPGIRPEKHENLEVPKIQTVTTNRMDLGIGLQFLKGFLSLFSAVPVLGDIGAAIKASFQRASLLEIEYDKVKEDMVYPVDLALFVEGFEWRGSPVFLSELLEKSKACVIYDYLKSSKLDLRAYDEKGNNVAPEVSVLKDLFKADAKIEVGSSEKDSVTFEGEKALPIAIKAMKVKITKAKRFQLVGWAADIFRKSVPSMEARELPTSHAAMEKLVAEKLGAKRGAVGEFETEEFSEEKGPVMLEWRGDE